MSRSTISHDAIDVPQALRAAGLQVTAQRLAVYKAVENTSHGMADGVLQTVYYCLMSRIIDGHDAVDVPHALRAAGLQVTAQRLAVYKAVESTPHVTADDVLQAVKNELGAISKQAVYDALNIMVEHGIIHRIQPAGSPARYEHRVDNHHHLACRQCESLIDIDCAIGEAPCLVAEHDHGYIIDEVEVTYWGICPACQKSRIPTNSP